MIQRRSATRRWNWLTRAAASFVRPVETQGCPRLRFLQRDPRGIAAGVNLGVVRSAEDRHERLTRARVAPAMSAPAKRRGLEMGGDVSDYSAALLVDLALINERTI
jgi:hypothetical protein